MADEVQTIGRNLKDKQICRNNSKDYEDKNLSTSLETYKDTKVKRRKSN